MIFGALRNLKGNRNPQQQEPANPQMSAQMRQSYRNMPNFQSAGFRAMGANTPSGTFRAYQPMGGMGMGGLRQLASLFQRGAGGMGGGGMNRWQSAGTPRQSVTKAGPSGGRTSIDYGPMAGPSGGMRGGALAHLFGGGPQRQGGGGGMGGGLGFLGGLLGGGGGFRPLRYGGGPMIHGSGGGGAPTPGMIGINRSMPTGKQ